MKRPVVLALLALLIGAGAGFAVGYRLGPGDRVKVPDLLGLGTQRGGQGEARPVLKDRTPPHSMRGPGFLLL
jgi:hypothetical protein